MKEERQESNESTREKYVAPTYARFFFESSDLMLLSENPVGNFGDDGEDPNTFGDDDSEYGY